MIFLLICFVLFGKTTTSFKWNTEILQIPPWKINSCDSISENCIDEQPKSCQVMCNEFGNCTFNVAVILPNSTEYVVNLEEALYTLKNAEKDARNRGILHENVTLNYQGYDDKCTQEYATIRVMAGSADFCAHIIFGPVCDYCLASVGRVAKYIGNHGTPVITPVGFSFDFTNQKTLCSNEFYMVINTGPADFRSYGEFFHLIMDRYGWTKVALMYEKNQQNSVSGENSCQLLMKSVMEEIKNVEHLDYNDGDLNLIGLNYSVFLQRQVGVHYGVILLCTSSKKVREIAIEAYKLNMMESGEYIIFNFEIYNDALSPSEPWFDVNDTQERNEMAKKAFKSIYTFTPISETKFNVIANTSIKRGSSYLDGLYDGMFLYANVINKLLILDSEGKPEQNQSFTGYNVTKEMMGIQFGGMNEKENITMNCNGQRTARYAMLNINSSGLYDIVAEYNNSLKNITKWKVQWLAKADPSDTPKCGFDMSLCPSMIT